MAEIDRMHESGDWEVCFTERALAEREKYRAEGFERGIEQGIEQRIAGVRNLLLRLAARKFDTRTSDRLAGLLSRMDDPEDLAEVGERIIQCASGDELIARASEIARSGS